MAETGFTITKSGNPTGWFARWHKHKFYWIEFLGADDFDRQSYSCRYTERWQCKCGAEGIYKVYGLV